MSTERIVVGIDGSPASKDALGWAKKQADMTGAELVAVSTWGYPVASFPMLVDNVRGRDEVDLAEETKLALARLVKEVTGDGTVTLEVVEGSPAKALIDTASRLGAQLVVVGSRGHGGLVGTLLGSVSQYVVSHAPCPVVVIRPMR